MAKCPYCGKKVGQNERYCSHCENDISEVADKSQSEHCFIATAAYGTTFAINIQKLRNFRDMELKKYLTGRLFIKIYYRISPPIAKIISRNEKMKFVVRKMLNPIIHLLDKKYDIKK